MTYIVKAPMEGYSGEVAGVHLVKGSYTGGLTPSALAYFQGAGYKVEQVAEPAPAEEGGKTPARSASKADWVAFATSEAGGQRFSAEDAEKLTRDQLAEKYLGPKQD
ncbi:hypothetical protein C5N14_13650 [Micromonospora sp. MW-13]|uniref:hypothetical protein n=1 Tax=Micromonospora sp. MW-13 TaxID=2094022 RepID=UPI000E44E67D|nr:hypothetical protein [Micromonospora sp. MW-13]RGC68426.1 hypothetical protein C5N14_13650 [Micromonospora sp. MW-13]